MNHIIYETTGVRSRTIRPDELKDTMKPTTLILIFPIFLAGCGTFSTLPKAYHPSQPISDQHLEPCIGMDES